MLSLVLDAFGPWSGRRPSRGRYRDRRAGVPADVADGTTEPAEWRMHPSTPLARWLIARFGDTETGPGKLPTLGPGGWVAVVGLPAVAVVLLEWLAGSVFSPLVLLLHVAVLASTVTLGPFYRRFSELRLLIGAGETSSADTLLRRWEARSGGRPGVGGPAPAAAAGVASVAAGAAGPAGVAAAAPTPATDGAATAPASAAASSAAASTAVAVEPPADPSFGVDGDVAAPPGLPGLERRAIAQSLLVCYRDVFGPLFWYLLLPGAVGAVIVHFARQAAVRTSGRARIALAWIDWLPLRLIGLVLALVGKFEETIDALRAVSPIARRADLEADPYAHQRLLLLPVAGASMGLAIADPATDAELRHAAPDLELPVAEPEAGALKPASALLGRSAAVLFGLYVLIIVLD